MIQLQYARPWQKRSTKWQTYTMHGNRSFFVGNYEKTLWNCGYYFIGKSNNTEHHNSEKLSILDFCLFVQVAFYKID